MIIGNGLIANSFSNFKEDQKILIFASGVSNSKEIDILQYDREANLLKNAILNNKDKKIIYFSTTSIYDKELSTQLYCKHKLHMEELIKELSFNFIIFRLPEIVGNNNKYQIIGFLIHKIKNKEPFEIWENATRHLIGISDVVKICSYLIYKKEYNNKIINISSPIKTPILDLVLHIEHILNKKAIYSFINKGDSYNIETPEMDSLKKKLDINFDEKYVNNLISRYYKL
ncbi:NAD-dependent epimerase/dehydratase family protein [Arcobacter sp.]|uniref:NAD-dependent epimerase/dehydratase family protein n=1 Tax=unclassified Arcobacter TaxID=2593671 RepID=UPI003B004675